MPHTYTHAYTQTHTQTRTHAYAYGWCTPGVVMIKTIGHSSTSIGVGGLLL